MTMRKPFEAVGGVALVGIALWFVGATAGIAQTAASNTSVQTGPGPTRVDTADFAIPSAQEVIVDLPSALHASRHQRGEINDLRYVLFPDGTGKVMQSTDQRSVLYRLDCTGGTSCNISGRDGVVTTVPASGGPKPALPTSPDGKALAQYLAKWVLVGVEPETQPIAVVSPTPSEEPTTEQSATKQALSTQDNAAPQNVRSETETLQPAIGESTQPKQQPPVQTQTVAVRTTAKPAAKPVHQRNQAVRKRAPVPVYTTTKTLALPPVRKSVESGKPTQARETYFQRLKLACSITGSVTLRYKNHSTGSERFGKPRASLGCSARLSDKFSLRLSVIGYADKNEKSPTDAEFTYALSYRATKKLTLTYSNYSARFSDSGGALVDSLTSGSLRANYRLPKIKLPNDKTIGCSASIGLAKPEDTTANLFCSYALTDKIRISASAYAYLPGKQDDFDPDFSYTASYRINDDWSVNYSNYANNRFFWNKSNSPGEGLLGGTLSMTYRFKF